MKYENPICEIVVLDNDDIIRTSVEQPDSPIVPVGTNVH